MFLKILHAISLLAVVSCGSFLKKSLTGERSYDEALKLSQRQPAIFEEQVLYQGQKVGTVKSVVLSQLKFDATAIREMAERQQALQKEVNAIIQRKNPAVWENGNIDIPACDKTPATTEPKTKLSAAVHVISGKTAQPVTTTFLLTKTRAAACVRSLNGVLSLEKTIDYEQYVYDQVTQVLTVNTSTNASADSFKLFDVHTPTEQNLLLHVDLFSVK